MSFNTECSLYNDMNLKKKENKKFGSFENWDKVNRHTEWRNTNNGPNSVLFSSFSVSLAFYILNIWLFSGAPLCVTVSSVRILFFVCASFASLHTLHKMRIHIMRRVKMSVKKNLFQTWKYAARMQVNCILERVLSLFLCLSLWNIWYTSAVNGLYIRGAISATASSIDYMRITKWI